MLDVFQYLGAGGDLATIAFFYLLWRLERRVLKLEVKSV